MRLRIRLEERQWKLLASAFSNISQAIILFSLASFFAPEVVNLTRDFSKIVAVFYLVGGLTILSGAAILIKKGK